MMFVLETKRNPNVDTGGIEEAPLFFFLLFRFPIVLSVEWKMSNQETKKRIFFILIASRSRLPYLESTRVFFFVDSKKKKFFKSEGKKKDKMKSQKKTKQT